MPGAYAPVDTLGIAPRGHRASPRRRADHLELERSESLNPSLRRLETRTTFAIVALAVWLIALGVAVFSPTSSRPNQIVDAWDHFLLRLGVPGSLATFALWEVLFNVAMMVPVGFLAPQVLRVRNRWAWLAIGFGCGAFIEATQALLLPARDPSWSDVISNGIGVFVGYLLLELAVRLRWLRVPRGMISVSWNRGEPVVRYEAIVLALPFAALVVIPFLIQLTFGGPAPVPQRTAEIPGVSPLKVPHPLHPAQPKK